mmetsp:Transcript_4915/g.13995  ORF Transcript_4915/g.13995 Transcript_4915/m.13995 type:complete len:257 (-) Transcript_4915:2128-2898(-)
MITQARTSQDSWRLSARIVEAHSNVPPAGNATTYVDIILACSCNHTNPYLCPGCIKVATLPTGPLLSRVPRLGEVPHAPHIHNAGYDRHVPIVSYPRPERKDRAEEGRPNPQVRVVDAVHHPVHSRKVQYGVGPHPHERQSSHSLDLPPRQADLPLHPATGGQMGRQRREGGPDRGRARDQQPREPIPPGEIPQLLVVVRPSHPLRDVQVHYGQRRYSRTGGRAHPIEGGQSGMIPHGIHDGGSVGTLPPHNPPRQ